MAYSIGIVGCQHLGYRMGGMKRLHPSGLNIREVDGFAAHRATYEDMLSAGVRGIVDGGDLYHVAEPDTEAINCALRVDDLRVDADTDSLIWRVNNGGNHDNGSGRHRSAVSTLHRPHLGCYAVFPDPTRPAYDEVTPHPGLYEIHQPDPNIPLYLHVVSHNGLDPALTDRGIHIDPRPLDGGVNLLFAHGIFSADGRLFGADERHGAERVIPAEWADRGFDQYLLSDYHTLGPIPGFGPEDGRERGQIWMTGSLLRRGYSDESCGRGWLHVTLTDDGRVTVEPRYVWQRPQVDFPPLDAATMSVEQIDAEVRSRLAAQPMWDEESEAMTGDGGVILRQTISNASPNQKPALRAASIEWDAIASRAAYFGVTYPNSIDIAARSTDRATQDRDTDSRVSSYVDEFTRRQQGSGPVARTLDALTDEIRERVAARATALLTDLSTTDA